MLKPTLNNLTIPDSILILEFIFSNYCMFLSYTLSLIFFNSTNAKKIWKKQFMKGDSMSNHIGHGTLTYHILFIFSPFLDSVEIINH